MYTLLVLLSRLRFFPSVLLLLTTNTFCQALRMPSVLTDNCLAASAPHNLLILALTLVAAICINAATADLHFSLLA
ncbi:hypothetical protein GQ54DRAFT_300547 [Martensiomyces pterosporus]|nr:hypothetical protein GQ54DRAFT_300547 [Martensiomyces pterosporus]